MEGYTVRIKNCNQELTGKQRVAIKDISNAIALDEVVTVDEHLIINPDVVAELEVHNEKAERKDYAVYVIIDKNGKKYTTSSESFFTSYKDIAEEMAGETEEWSLDVYKLESKNFKGKYFITCTII